MPNPLFHPTAFFHCGIEEYLGLVKNIKRSIKVF